MTMLDPQLVLIATGDTDAFATWMAGAEPRIRASLSSFATKVDTEAVVQECLLRVWQVAPRLKPDDRPDSLTRFAIRTARNLAITDLRRRRPELLTDELLREHPDDERPPDAIPDEALRDTIAECLKRLPNKPKLAMTSRLGGAGRPDAVIADRIGMTLNTFLQNIRRARLALADCLREHGIEVGYGP